MWAAGLPIESNNAPASASLDARLNYGFCVYIVRRFIGLDAPRELFARARRHAAEVLAAI